MDVQEQQTVTILTEHQLDANLESVKSECDGNGESVGLLMTYRCNLACKYCYIHTKRNKDMPLETAKGILERFLMKNGGPLDIIFVGGETLLASNTIRSLVEWAEQGTWNRDYRFFGSTNGTLLTDELKSWLIAHRERVILGLSYDGIPSIQSENRGANDIDVDFFIRTWPKQPIQMTINSESVGSMAEGVKYLLEKGAVVHPNVAFEETEWSVDKISIYKKQLYKLIVYYQSHPEKPMISQFVHNLNEYASNIDNPKKQTEVCGAGNGYQVFDIDGLSYPCHILSPLVLAGDKLYAVKNGLVAETNDFSDAMCLGCPYNTSCPTCIACNYNYRDTMQQRDKTHCAIMKAEVQMCIKKEVMRLSMKQEITSADAKEIKAIKKIFDFIKQM